MEVNEPHSGTIQIKGCEGALIRYIIQINGSEGSSVRNIFILIIHVKGPQTWT